MENSEHDILINFSNRTSSIEQLDKLCQHLIAKKKFSVLTYEENGKLVTHGNGFDPTFYYPFLQVQELISLAKDFDRILVRTDGFSFVIYCIKNGFDGEQKTTVSLEKLRNIGKECLSYTGTVHGNKMPIILDVVEVTNAKVENVSHLKLLTCMPGKQKVVVKAFMLNVRTGSVWTNAPLNGIFAGRIFFQKALASISKNETINIQKFSAIKSQVSKPLLTYGFLTTFVCIFLVELMASQSFLTPSGATLVAFGGLNNALVFQKSEWYRLISAAFLHGDFAHLVLNCIAFFFSGLVLEVMLGRAWLLTIFILSAIGGSFASLFLNSPETLSVGASGGIMGLVAALFMITFRLPYGPQKSQIQIRTMFTFLPAVFPVFMQRDGVNIDYAAHVGGAITGFIIAFIIYKSWAKESPEPGLMKLAKGLAILCSVITAIASAQAIQKQRQHISNPFIE